MKFVGEFCPGGHAMAIVVTRALTAITGCAANDATARTGDLGATPAPAPTDVTEDAEDSALAAWARFPVDARPRPIIIGVLPLSRGFADGPRQASRHRRALSVHRAAATIPTTHRPRDQ